MAERDQKAAAFYVMGQDVVSEICGAVLAEAMEYRNVCIVVTGVRANASYATAGAGTLTLHYKLTRKRAELYRKNQNGCSMKTAMPTSRHVITASKATYALYAEGLA